MGSGVAGSCVGGTEVVGSLVAVGWAGIFVGAIEVVVEGAMPVVFESGFGTLVRGVNVAVGMNRVGVLVGVFVGVGVEVRVGVGVREAVGVGTVAVGNGPSSEPAVAAMAVFVSAARCLLAGSEVRVSPKPSPASTTNKPMHKRIGIRTCCRTSFSFGDFAFIFEAFRSSSLSTLVTLMTWNGMTLWI